MIETAKSSGVWLLLLPGALSFLLFATSCGKKEAATASTESASAAPVAVAPELPMNVPRELEEYKDPKGAFAVMLPKAYVFSDKTVGDKPKYIFTYGATVNLILTQAVAPAEWDSAAEMAKKQDEIRTGRAGFPPGMALLGRELVSFGGLKGFETLLAGNLAGQEVQMKAYYVAGDGKLFTLIVTCKDNAAGVLYGQLQSTITNSFRLASFKQAAPVPPKPAAAPAVAPVVPAVTAAVPAVVSNIPASAKASGTNVARKPVAPVVKEKPVEVVEPVLPVDPRTDAEWAAARAMLKFTGSMKMGGQEVAMVNDKILRKGDTISVMFHDTEFTFIVMNISANGVEYKRQPLQ